nr:hypothetical protein [Ornithinimicrobium sediminis]
MVLFGLALMVWFLGRDLSRRLRRMRQAESLRREQVERAAAPRADGAASSPPAGDEASGPPTDPVRPPQA